MAWEKWAKTRNDMDSGWSVKKAMKMPKFLYLISPVLGKGHTKNYSINCEVMIVNVKDQTEIKSYHYTGNSNDQDSI